MEQLRQALSLKEYNYDNNCNLSEYNRTVLTVE